MCPEREAGATAMVPANAGTVADEAVADGKEWVDCLECGTVPGPLPVRRGVTPVGRWPVAVRGSDGIRSRPEGGRSVAAESTVELGVGI